MRQSQKIVNHREVLNTSKFVFKYLLFYAPQFVFIHIYLILVGEMFIKNGPGLFFCDRVATLITVQVVNWSVFYLFLLNNAVDLNCQRVVFSTYLRLFLGESDENATIGFREMYKIYFCVGGSNQ